MNNYENKKTGFFKNNPVLGLSLGLTTALAVTTSLTSAVGMGIVMMLLLYVTSIVCGIVKKLVSDTFTLPVNLVIIAFLVKLTELLVMAYAPTISDGVGIFLPLLVSSSLLLFGAGTFNKEEESVGNLLGVSIKAGLSYFFAIVLVALIREILGTGGISFVDPFSGTQVFSFTLIPTDYVLNLFVQPAGALLVVGLVAALFAAIGNVKKTAVKGGK